jgi:hypothetical protein
MPTILDQTSLLLLLDDPEAAQGGGQGVKPNSWTFVPGDVAVGNDQTIANALQFFVPMWEGTGDPSEIVGPASADAGTSGMAWVSPEPTTGPKLDAVFANAATLLYANGDKATPTTAITVFGKFTPSAVPAWTPFAYDTNISSGAFLVRQSSSTSKLNFKLTFTTAGTIDLTPSSAWVDDDTYFFFLRWAQGGDITAEIFNDDGTQLTATTNSSVGGSDTLVWNSGFLRMLHQEAASSRHWNGEVDYFGYTNTDIGTTLRDHIIANPYDFFTRDVINDTTPEPYDIPNLTDLAVSTSYDSASVSITGIDASTPVTVTGDASNLIINDVVQAGLTGNVVNNDTIGVRMTTSASYSTAVTANIDVGGVLDSTSFTTEAAAPITLPADDITAFVLIKSRG